MKKGALLYSVVLPALAFAQFPAPESFGITVNYRTLMIRGTAYACILRVFDMQGRLVWSTEVWKKALMRLSIFQSRNKIFMVKSFCTNAMAWSLWTMPKVVIMVKKTATKEGSVQKSGFPPTYKFCIPAESTKKTQIPPTYSFYIPAECVCLLCTETTKTNKQVFFTLLTTFPLVPNEQSLSALDMNCLFEQVKI